MIRLAGTSSFQWSSSEQVYPFEKDSDGKTVYAKKLSTTVAFASYSVNHGLTGFTLFKLWGTILQGTTPMILPMVSTYAPPTYNIELAVSATACFGALGTAWGAGAANGLPVHVYLLYTKAEV